MEALWHGLVGFYDRMKQALMPENDRPNALREAMVCVCNGGTVAIAGVSGGFADTIPLGSLMNRSITIKTGQTHVQRYRRPLLERIERDEIDEVVLTP